MMQPHRVGLVLSPLEVQRTQEEFMKSTDTARAGWALIALGVLALFGGCDSRNPGGVALCVNPTTQVVEQCCFTAAGTYVPCSTITPIGGDAEGADTLEPPLDGTGGSDGGVGGDVALMEDTEAPDAGPPTDVPPTDVESDGSGVVDVPPDTTADVAEDVSCEECTVSEVECAGPSTRRVCTALEGGCTAWVIEPCGDGQQCEAGICITPCKPAAPCPTAGARTCNGAVVQECGEEAPGCLGWGDVQTCGASQVCVDGACEAAPECPAATKCKSEGSKTCDATGKTLLMCKPVPGDAACLQWTKDKDCLAGQICDAAACVQGPSGTLTCTDYVHCIADCGSDACKTGCADKAKPGAVGQFTDLQSCANANCVQLNQLPYSFEHCYFTKCSAQVKGCEGFFIPGTGGCGALDTCVADCGGTSSCVMSCFDAVDMDGYVKFLAMWACIEQKCDTLYEPGSAQWQNCAGSSCASQISACGND